MSDVNLVRLGALLFFLVSLEATLQREPITCKQLKSFTPCTAIEKTE